MSTEFSTLDMSDDENTPDSTGIGDGNVLDSEDEFTIEIVDDRDEEDQVAAPLTEEGTVPPFKDNDGGGVRRL